MNDLAESVSSTTVGGDNIHRLSPLIKFGGHKDEGYAIDWSPTVPGRLVSGKYYFWLVKLTNKVLQNIICLFIGYFCLKVIATVLFTYGNLLKHGTSMPLPFLGILLVWKIYK